ncbi:MAG: SUMF1/EgtB/PvdO family nonheme iron enzyme [Lewinellaceae bacterium]|nr:SUMF1/EgtB/PvdO family nonheme iron enzyme [Lewinellaceae bacterium]
MAHQNHHPIFISYRTADTTAQAGRLRDSINHHFGWEAAFLDTRLKAGEEWPVALRQRVEQAQAVLVLLRDRSKWLGVDPDLGGRRIDDPKDWVFQEVNTALQGEALVIPVLFGAAELPPKEALPVEINTLPDKQAIRFLDERAWEVHLPPLLERLEDKVSKSETPAASPQPYDPLEKLPIVTEAGIPAYPYKGLQWFTSEDARIFFGRGEDIRQLYEKLENPYSRITLFYGQSGAGKSSLLHAGFLPRLPEPWAAAYRRRTRDGTATAIVQDCIAWIKEDQIEQPLLILDQLEEMYTNPEAGEPDEIERLPFLLRELLEASPNAQVILGYREDYHGRVDHLLRDNGITPLPHLLPVLDGRKIRRAVSGILEDKNLSDCYRGLRLAEGEDKLPARIAQDLMSRPDSRGNAAPLLQFILLQMWKEVKTHQPPQFSWDLYARHRRASMLDLLDARMEALRDTLPKAEQNGLALDLLRALVTPDNTAGKLAEPALLQRYAQIPEDLLRRLCQALENNYLISNYAEDGHLYWRLAHDALAPAVQRRFEESPRPGQRAWYILNAKGKDALKGGAAIRFSESDVDIIRDGLEGMPDIDEALKAKIETDRQYYLAQRENNFKLAFNTALDNVEHLSHDDALSNLQLAHREGLYPEKVREKARELPYPLAFLGAVQSSVFKVRGRTGKQQFATEGTQVHEHAPFLQAKAQLEQALQLILDISEGQDGHWAELQALAPSLPPDHLFQEIEAWLQKKDEPLYHQMRQRFFPNMVDVPGGTFEMGAKGEELVFRREGPAHTVSVDPFQLADTPVTCWQYGLYCLATGRLLPQSSGFGRGPRPVINVSWYEAVAYANWLSLQQGLAPAYRLEEIPPDPSDLHQSKIDWNTIVDWNAPGYRLPTEAEWEFAASARIEKTLIGTSRVKKWRFGNGKEVADPDEMNFDASSITNSSSVNRKWMREIRKDGFRAATTPVKFFAKSNENPFGLHDMSGNVYEWCWDWYSGTMEDQTDQYYTECQEKGKVHNPRGAASGSYRVARGGSWYDNALGCRAAARYRLTPIVQNTYLGVRVSRRP